MMTTRKSSKKKSKKGAARKAASSRSGARKSARKKAAGKKAAGVKGGAKRAAASSKAGKKAAGKSRGGAAKKATVKKVATTDARSTKLKAAPTLQGNCIDMSTAGFIIERAIGSGSFDIDKTLEALGLISDNQRAIFKQRVLNDVRIFGCTIMDGDVPNDGDTTARDVRDAIHLKAGK